MTGDTPTPAAGTDQKTALSRELSDFLIQLSIALHRFAMYPSGHPSLRPTVDAVIEYLTNLLQTSTTLSLGVARTQLVIEGVATDAKNPVLKDLANRLHRHHIGAVTFRTGVLHHELQDLLRTVAVDPDRTEKPIGLDPGFDLQGWPHIRLFPLSYDRLRLLGDDVTEDETEETRSARTRAAQLWVGLARAAMAAEQAAADQGGTEADKAEADPKVVAQAIQKHGREAAYDQVIVGYMLQIADELKAGKTPESGTLKKRISSLVSNLDKGTLSNLLEMGGDRSQRRQFLLSASEGMAVDAVVDLVEAASKSEHQTISNSFLRMLTKMTQHAEQGTGRRRTEAETSVREQISNLIRGWTLTDPNPDEYRDALQRMATGKPIFAVAPDQHYLPEARRVLQMALELDVTGEALERAVTQLLEEGQTKWLLDMVQEANAPTAAKTILAKVANPDQIARLLAKDQVDAKLLDRELEYVGLDAADALLDALVDSQSSHTRRMLLTRIVGLGVEVGPFIVDRLDDQRWYVKRNMLALLSELDAQPPDFEPLPFAQDPDGRVRREALRIALRKDALRERAICLGLADDDDQCVRLALTAAARSCPGAAIPLLVSRATSGANRDQRVMAIRVLSATGSRDALAALLRVVAPRKSLLGRKAPSKSPEYLAALTGLTKFPDEPRAQDALAEAARSKDRDIARAARGAHVEDDQAP